MTRRHWSRAFRGRQLLGLALLLVCIVVAAFAWRLVGPKAGVTSGPPWLASDLIESPLAAAGLIGVMIVLNCKAVCAGTGSQLVRLWAILTGISVLTYLIVDLGDWYRYSVGVQVVLWGKVAVMFWIAVSGVFWFRR